MHDSALEIYNSVLQNIRKNNEDAQLEVQQPQLPRRIRLFRERNNELDRVTPKEFFQN